MGDDDYVEVDEETMRLLRLREAEIAAGRAKLTKPISSAEIRARKIVEPKGKQDE